MSNKQKTPGAMAEQVAQHAALLADQMKEVQCLGKEALSGGVAKKIANRMRHRGSNGPHAYRCRLCGRWHVGRPNRQPHVVRTRERVSH